MHGEVKHSAIAEVETSLAKSTSRCRASVMTSLRNEQRARPNASQPRLSFGCSYWLGAVAVAAMNPAKVPQRLRP